MYPIDYNSYRSVSGFNRRVRFLVMHYTAMNFAGSARALTGKNVSVHYLVPDPTDPTYTAAGFTGMRIFNLVDEQERAWHAGRSTWAGRSNLNDTAIGIEIVSLASNNKGHFVFPPYNPDQIEAIKQLATNILQRYPDIIPTQVVGHSDIAPGRKTDPGAAFPWEELYRCGVGAWYNDETKQKYTSQFTTGGIPDRNSVIAKFKKYGYDTSEAATDSGFCNLVRSLQLHFRQSNYDGTLDVETAAILYALVEKYFPA